MTVLLTGFWAFVLLATALWNANIWRNPFHLDTSAQKWPWFRITILPFIAKLCNAIAFEIGGGTLPVWSNRFICVAIFQYRICDHNPQHALTCSEQIAEPHLKLWYEMWISEVWVSVYIYTSVWMMSRLSCMQSTQRLCPTHVSAPI